jgi:WD40 repeat protein
MYVGRKTLPDISKIHIPSGELSLTFNGHRYTVFGLAVSTNRLFSASEDATIRQWNSVTGSIILTYYGHSDSVYVVSLYNNELYTGGRDLLVIKWSIDDGRILRTFPVEHSNSIYCYTFKDQLLYSGALDGAIVQWDLNTGLPGYVYESRNMKLWSVVPWGNFIICSGEDAMISLWDSTVNSVMESAIIVGHSSPVNCLVVYESTLFSGDSDAFIRHWNLTDLGNLRVLIGM